MMNNDELQRFYEAHPWVVYDEANNVRIGCFATLLGAARTVVQRPDPGTESNSWVVYGPDGATVGRKGCHALVHQWDFENGEADAEGDSREAEAA